MKLRATIIIDFEAKDFMDAANQQQELDKLAAGLSKKYKQVTFDIRERREFKAARGRKKKG